MSNLKYRWILYLIAIVILATLAIQSYWTYKNYLSGKQQLMNDVQESLNTAVDNYYSLLARQTTYTYITSSDTGNFNFSFENKLTNGTHLEVHSFSDSLLKNADVNRKFFAASNLYNTGIRLRDSVKIKVDTLQIIRKPIEALTTKVMVSMSQDSLSLHKIDSLFTEELSRKNIKINYDLLVKNSLDPNELSKNVTGKLTAQASSVYIPRNINLSIEYNNITLQVLRKNLFGIFLSSILLASVIASLLYLFKIIRHQKNLAEVKNDLISNITHEFKTPLATIGIAMEGITQFNSEKADEKTQRYAQITTEQVKKLNLMVEKLLETATLDSSQLIVNKEPVNLNELLTTCIKNQNITSEKTISIHLPEQNISCLADAFHLENALNNIIDNALKYGGNEINITLKNTPKNIQILISDSGTSLKETQKQLIFDKFYRIPTGNIHEIKGFGIGLYYTKKIIEKHHGNIAVELQKNKTIFKIELPNE